MPVPGDGQPLNEGSALVSIAQTDDSGRYRLEDIPPGRYFIVAGPLARMTFHPGTTEQSAATIVTIGPDGSTRTGLDFALNAVSALTSGNICCRFAGQIVTEDGSPLPNVLMQVNLTGPIQLQNIRFIGTLADAGGFRRSINANVALAEGGSFQLMLPAPTGKASFTVQGLPPGYFLKTVTYGGKTYSPDSAQIDGKSSAVVLTLGYEPLSTLTKVSVRGRFVNIPRELSGTSLNLVSTIPNGPAFEVTLQSDGTFELSNIPIGVYRVVIRRTTGSATVSGTGVVIRAAASNLTINLRDNPFPEFERFSPAPSPFLGGTRMEISGVATQKLTPISPQQQQLPRERTAYFRMDVKDELTGVVTSWAVHVEKDWQVPNVKVGDRLSFSGVRSADGTNRLSADPF